jgi:hypothetical protein
MPTLIAMLLAVLVSGMLIAYYVGFTAGRHEGFERGRQEGKREGSIRAYAVGYDRGRHERQTKEATTVEAESPHITWQRWSGWIVLVVLSLLAIVAAAVAWPDDFSVREQEKSNQPERIEGRVQVRVCLAWDPLDTAFPLWLDTHHDELAPKTVSRRRSRHGGGVCGTASLDLDGRNRSHRSSRF